MSNFLTSFLALVCLKSVKIHEISEIVLNFQNLLDFREIFAKFRPNFIKISLKNSDFEQISQSVTKISAKRQKLTKSADFRIQSGAKVCKFCRSRKMQKNDYLLAKFGVDTAENEPLRARLRARLFIASFGVYPF